MKIKILKTSGVTAVSSTNPDKSRRYPYQSVVKVNGSHRDMFAPNTYHFYDCDNYVFQADDYEYETV
jgi:hypothetical protein